MDPAAPTHVDQPMYYTHVPPSAGYPQQYTPYYPQEHYLLSHAAAHQHVVMPIPAQPYIYVPQGQPAYPAQYIAVQPQPVYYPPDVYAAGQPVLPAQLPVSTNAETSSQACRPLSTSTPVPPEMANCQPHMIVCSVPQPKQNKSAEFDDQIIDNLSRISVSDYAAADETMCDSNERTVEAATGRRSGVFPTYNYKTRLCAQFSDRKYCDQGANCRFAHGSQELRSGNAQTRMNNSKYKTRLCKNFLNYKDASGSFFCPYGTRCEFIHPSDKEFANLPASVRNTVPPSMLGTSTSSNDVTPEAMGDYPHAGVITRSAAKPPPEKVLLKSRNIAGSMMCLATAGQRDRLDDGMKMNGMAAASSLTVLNKKPKSRVAPSIPLKFARRRSRSQLSVKRWSSSEALA